MDNLRVNLKRVGQKVHFETVSQDHPDLSIPFDYVPRSARTTVLPGWKRC